MNLRLINIDFISFYRYRNSICYDNVAITSILSPICYKTTVIQRECCRRIQLDYCTILFRSR